MEDKAGQEERNFFDDLRARTRAYRAEKGLIQEQLADMIGAGRPALANFEIGKHLLREAPLNRLIVLLDDPAHVIASELRNLADMLDSDRISPDVKVERLFNRLSEFQVREIPIRAAICETNDGGT
jgi:transcriptional regulator with XRE-family HTH domain